jgi:phosphoribosyl 1,2-cyclic phosphodiesterase
MRARIWGCRGSLATPGADTLRYGGNTSCVEVRLDDGTLIVLDAGTGIRSLGLALGANGLGAVHLLLTHLHFDHLEGLGFFAPLRHSGTDVHVWGPPSPIRTLESRISRYLSPPLFPLQISDFPARLTFHDVPDGDWQIGTARVTAAHIVHLGPTVGFRIEEDGWSLAYLPDHEPALAADLETFSPDWISGHALAHRADILLHDSQYTEDEYPARVGWGHSSVADTVAFARVAEARRLVLFHHDPLHADGDLELLRERACDLWNGAGDGSTEPVLAREGMALARDL